MNTSKITLKWLMVPLLLLPLSSQADIERQEAAKRIATAINNYQAQARENEYKLEEQKFFMGPPGIEFSMRYGLNLETSLEASYERASNLVNKSMEAGLNVEKPTGSGPKFELVEKYGAFFEDGDVSRLGNLNAQNFLYSNSISDSDGQTASEKINEFVTMMTNPFPQNLEVDQYRNDDGKVDLEGVDADVKERLAHRLAEQAALSLSISALSEIGASRISQGGELSETQRIEQAGTFRMTTSDWYKEIGVSSNEALLRELAHMMAYNTYMNYKFYRQNETMIALMSLTAAGQAKMTAVMEMMSQSMNSPPGPEE